MQRVHLIISGDVVGVGYRAWVERVDIAWQKATGEFLGFAVVY